MPDIDLPDAMQQRSMSARTEARDAVAQLNFGAD
jgi:hypothetical protein